MLLSSFQPYGKYILLLGITVIGYYFITMNNILSIVSNGGVVLSSSIPGNNVLVSKNEADSSYYPELPKLVEFTELKYRVTVRSLICQVFWLDKFDNDNNKCIASIPIGQQEWEEKNTSSFEKFRDKKSGRGIVWSVADESAIHYVVTTIQYLQQFLNGTDVGFEIMSERANVVKQCNSYRAHIRNLYCASLPAHQAVEGRYFMYKSVAVAQSRFRHILFLDSDSIPVIDPQEMFDSEEYKTTGALYWADLWGSFCMKRSADLHLFPSPGVYGQAGYPNHVVWQFFDMQWEDKFEYAQEMESGQMVIDSVKHFDIVKFAYKCSVNSFLMKVILGDKDCWRLGALWLKKPFHYGTRTPSEIGHMIVNVFKVTVFRRELLLQYFHDEPAFIHQYKTLMSEKDFEKFLVYKYPDIVPEEKKNSNCPPVYIEEDIHPENLKPGFTLTPFPGTILEHRLKQYNKVYWDVRAIHV